MSKLSNHKDRLLKHFESMQILLLDTMAAIKKDDLAEYLDCLDFINIDMDSINKITEENNLTEE